MTVVDGPAPVEPAPAVPASPAPGAVAPDSLAPQAIALRPMRWTDLDQVLDLEQRCYPHDAWSAAAFWAELAARPRREYHVAVLEDRVVGYAGLDLAGEVADVMTVAVDPDVRGRGLGTELLELLHTGARRAGAEGMMLEVRDDNTPARALYERQGYVTVHRRRGYYRTGDGSPAVDALVMRKELS